MPKKPKAKRKPAKRRVRHERGKPSGDANKAAFQLLQSIANRP
jgi:hypothetical protein